MKVKTILSCVAPLGAALLLAGCAAPGSRHAITQVATIDALLAGVYDGHTCLADLRRHGDFGIGTFEALDGEMILLDGRFYQARADGTIRRPGRRERTPFACVVRFEPDQEPARTGPLDAAGLEARINALVPPANRFCAIRLRGTFDRMRVRSVPPQTKPYPPLAEVTPHQPVFDRTGIRGTLVGFRAPPFVRGVNVPGFHLHFIADDESCGGHVLAFALTEGWLETDSRHDRLTLLLPPDSEAFDRADMARDRTEELHRVEQERR